MVGKDNRRDEVSVLSWPICDPPIHIGDEDADLSHGDGFVTWWNGFA